MRTGRAGSGGSVRQALLALSGPGLMRCARNRAGPSRRLAASHTHDRSPSAHSAGTVMNSTFPDAGPCGPSPAPLGAWRTLLAALSLPIAGLFAPDLAAQCTTPWLPGLGAPGFANGYVAACTAWDPDGAGPAPSTFVCGGDFLAAGSTAVRHLAMLDPASGSWMSLGTGLDGPVDELLALPNGDLVAGGWFSQAGGVSAFRIARWSGASWAAFGPGIACTAITALTAQSNGNVVAGYFSQSGSTTVYGVASWNGAVWTPLATSPNGAVQVLTTLPNGDVVAGGDFTVIGGVAANRIARWNGTVWSPLGTGANLAVNALATLPNGDLVAGGRFTAAGGFAVNRIASWNGAIWSPLGAGVAGLANADVRALTVLPSGVLVAGGNFTSAGGGVANRVASWNGTAWTPLGAGTTGSVNAVASLPSGEVGAVGDFTLAGGVPVNRFARWNGVLWSSSGTGGNGPVLSMAALPGTDVVVGGSFSAVGGVAANHIARRSGSTWSPLGTGTSGPVHSVAVLPNGDVVAGGLFATAGGVAVGNIARWDGAAWWPLGSGVTGSIPAVTDHVYALLVLPNGDVLAGGSFVVAGGVAANGIARWNGAAWAPLGTGFAGSLATVKSLAMLPNGDVVAGGQFTVAGGVPASSIARWDGTAWSPLGSGIGGHVHAVTTLPNGDVVAGGNFLLAGGITCRCVARWNGAWSPLGLGVGDTVFALTALPNGDVVAGGQFLGAGSSGAGRIARWNGVAWSTFGTGVGGSSPSVQSLATLANGDIAVGGNFAQVDGAVAAYFAAITTTCPATAVSNGSGCAGSGGPNVLVATALPWIGATFRARGTGMPALGLALAVTGFSPLSTPLASLLPQGQPGCTLLATPDLLELLVPVAGDAQSSLPLPNVPALVGLSLLHQLVAVELDAVGTITALTSTNALSVSLGGY